LGLNRRMIKDVKFAVSVALVILLLGMPVGCILAGYAPAHPCCPRTSVVSKCPYDALDNAKIASIAAHAVLPAAVSTGILPPSQPVLRDLLPEIAEDQPDLYVLNRILRI
jgi:hypothetical protein